MRRSAYVKRRTMPSVVLSILVLLVAVEAWAEQYLITTVAGGGLPPTPVRAVDVSLGLFTWAVTVDTSGNLYFTANNCVFRMDRLGVLTRVAGASPGARLFGGWRPSDKRVAQHARRGRG